LNQTNSAHSSPINNFESFEECDIDTGNRSKGNSQIIITKPQNHIEIKFTNLNTIWA